MIPLFFSKPSMSRACEIISWFLVGVKHSNCLSGLSDLSECMVSAQSIFTSTVHLDEDGLRFLLGVSKNRGVYPKLSILIGVSIIFTIHFGGFTPIFGNILLFVGAPATSPKNICKRHQCWTWCMRPRGQPVIKWNWSNNNKERCQKCVQNICAKPKMTFHSWYFSSEVSFPPKTFVRKQLGHSFGSSPPTISQLNDWGWYVYILLLWALPL